MSESVRVAVVYYSATGSVHEIARSVAEGAEKEGAEVRLLRVAELAPPEAIAANPGWQAHTDATADLPRATVDDVLWADAVVFGTPTRFGNLSAQLKQFMDTFGREWMQGLLADKVYSGFTSTATTHGGHESTLLALYASICHFGGIVVPPGYTDPIKFEDGNPYGTSHVDGMGALAVSEVTRAAARHQGARVATIAGALVAGKALASR